MTQRVKLNNKNSNESVFGTIVGTGLVRKGQENPFDSKPDATSVVYLIELDHGYHDEIQDRYTNIIVVPHDADYLKRVS